MVSKNNQQFQTKDFMARRRFRYGLRKTTLGVASVLLGTTIFMGLGGIAHADTVNATPVDQPATNSSQGTANQTQSQTGNSQQVVHDGYTTNGQGVTGQIDSANAASHVVPAQSINLDNYFKENYSKTTDTEQSLKYAPGISANFNQNTYQNDPVAAGEKIDYQNLTTDQRQRINQYMISLVNTVRQQMGFPDYETNPALIEWQQGQAVAQENRHLFGHHPEYLHGAGEDVGNFLINNQIGKPFSQWKPTDFKFKRDSQTHVVVMVTPIGALFTMDDLQAMEYYLTNAYLFEDDGAEANGHGHNLTDWNPVPHIMVALGIAGFHQAGGNGQTEGDQMFNRFIIANGDTARVAGADQKQNIVAVPNPTIAQQVIHLVDDTDNSNQVPDVVVRNPQGTVLTATPALPHGYMLSAGQKWPTSFDFTNGSLPDLTVHVQHVIDTLTDTRANAQFRLRVHYQADGQTLAPDTLVTADFHRDYTIDEVTGKTTIGDWQYVKGTLKQSGSSINGVGDPSAPIKGNGSDTFKIWLPFSVPVKGYHVNYTGLMESWSLPTGSGWVASHEANYTVAYVPDDQQVTEYQDRQVTVHFRDDQGNPVAEDAVLAVRYVRNKTTYMSGAKKGQTEVSDWNFVGSNYNDDGFSHGMKALTGSWNIPASWNIVSVNVPQIAGYTIDTSGGSENVNHVPANEFVYPTFDKNVFTSAETVYEAKPEHTIIYHEIPNFTVNVVDDVTGQVIGTTGKLLNPNNGSYATMKWNNGIDQASWRYHVTSVTGVPDGFKLAGNYFHVLNDQTSFTDLTYPNFSWSNGTKYTGAVMSIHVIAETIPVNYQFLDNAGNVISSGMLKVSPGVKVDADQIAKQVPAGWQLINGQVANIAKQTVGKGGANFDLLLTKKTVLVNVNDDLSTLGIKPTDLKRTVARTIIVKNSAGKVINRVVQVANFYRTATVDPVTNQVAFGDWSGSRILVGYQPKALSGMAALSPVKSMLVTADDQDLTVELQYQPKVVTSLIQYVDLNGHVLKQEKVIGQQAKLTAPVGYQLATDDQLVLDDSGRTYDVLVTPKQEVNAANSHQFSQSLTKVVSRTIVIHEANGRVRRIVQKVYFKRTGKVNADGSETYGNWQAIGRTQFNRVYIPRRFGYHIVMHNDQQELAKINKVTGITADMANEVITVNYVKN